MEAELFTPQFWEGASMGFSLGLLLCAFCWLGGYCYNHKKLTETKKRAEKYRKSMYKFVERLTEKECDAVIVRCRLQKLDVTLGKSLQSHHKRRYYTTEKENQ